MEPGQHLAAWACNSSPGIAIFFLHRFLGKFPRFSFHASWGFPKRGDNGGMPAIEISLIRP
jgi:hypothetical protein